jgi:hypothetical protein
MNQRIETYNRLQVFAVTVRPEAKWPELRYPPSPAGHARSPGVPGKTT